MEEGESKAERARFLPASRWALWLLLLSAVAIFCLVAKASERHREIARTNAVVAQGMLLSLALQGYLSDHHDTFPAASHWEEQLAPYLSEIHGRVVSIAASAGDGPRRFAMNPYLSGRARMSLAAPAGTVVFFESAASGPDAADALRSVPAANAGGDAHFVVVYADGWTWTLPVSWRKEFVSDEAQRELLGEAR